MVDVDFVVNCFERNYRRVLAPGFLARLAEQQRYPFATRTALVNNVDDVADAARMADALVAANELDRWVGVADRLPQAIARTRHRPLGRLANWTSCCLVAVCLEGPDWLVYWDADAVLREPADWVSPLLEQMLADPTLAVGNPNNWHKGLAVREALRVEEPFAFGYGFSDVAFMARRSDLCRPIYRKVAPASWRYPLAHIEPIFEQEIDAWMRWTGRGRVTYLRAVVDHPDPAGSSYPSVTVKERARGLLMAGGRALAGRISAHPAMRAYSRRAEGDA